MSELLERSRPKVSVALITYNHAVFIAQAIESVLMQKTNFDCELVIGEDDSSDGTREIVKSYKEQYPDKIRLLLNERNKVIYINGRPTGRWNFVNTLQHCTGQYVALLEGDDYWTSSHKLQKQVDYLDAHSECSMCCHNVMQLYEDRSLKPHNIHPFVRKQVYSLGDLLRGNFIATCSLVYRNHLLSEFPDWFYTVAMADWPFFMMIAQYGDIGYLDEAMGIYRIHGKGIWSTVNKSENLRGLASVYQAMLAHLDSSYAPLVKSALFFNRYQSARIEGDWFTALYNLSKSFLISPLRQTVVYYHLLRTFGQRWSRK